MSGAIPLLPQYAFMAWCSAKAKVKLFYHISGGITRKFTPLIEKAHHWK
jgi:hypothetical protein